MMDNSNFFSLDKLVEFGLSVAIAQQMINTLNQGMKDMYIPGSIMSMPARRPQENIYVLLDNEKVGPLDENQFIELVNRRSINKDTMAWIPGISAWQPISNLPQLLKIIALTPPAN